MNGQTVDRKTGLRVLLTLLLLVAGAVAALSPTDKASSTYGWTAARGDLVVAPLVDPTPATLTVQGEGIPVENGQVLGTYISAQQTPQRDDLIVMTIFADSVGLWITLETQSGGWESTVKLASRSSAGNQFPDIWNVTIRGDIFSYSSAETAGSRTLPAGKRLVVNSLNSQEVPSGGMFVELKTSGRSENSPSSIHGIAVLVGLVVFLLLLLSETRPIRRLKVCTKPSLADLTVFVSCILSALITMPFADDGWVLARSRLLVASEWSLNSQLIDPYQEGIANIQGFIYESLLGLTVGRSNVIVVERGLSISAIVVTWLILSRVVLPRFSMRSTPMASWFFVGIFVLYSWGWMTLRAEVFINLLSMALLGVILSRNLAKRPTLQVLLLGGLSGLALSTHQTGTTTAAASGFAILVIWFRNRANWARLGVAVLGSASVAVLLVFVNQNLRMLRGSMNEYKELQEVWGNAPAGLLSELQRFQHYSIVASTPQRILFVVCLLGFGSLVIIAIARWQGLTADPTLKLATMVSIVMPFGLLATSSKWAWHYSVLLVPGIVGLLLLLRELQCKQPKKYVSILLGVGVGVLIYYAVSTTDRDLSYANVIFAFSLVAIAVLYGLFGVRTRGYLPYLSSLLALCAFTVIGLEINSARAAAVNSVSGWTFPRQSILGIVDSVERCGVPSFIPSSTDGTISAQEEISRIGGWATTRPDSYLFSPCIKNPTFAKGLWQPAYFSMGDPGLGQALFGSVPGLPRECLAQSGQAAPNSWSCVQQLLPYYVRSISKN